MLFLHAPLGSLCAFLRGPEPNQNTAGMAAKWMELYLTVPCNSFPNAHQFPKQVLSIIIQGSTWKPHPCINMVEWARKYIYWVSSKGPRNVGAVDGSKTVEGNTIMHTRCFSLDIGKHCILSKDYSCSCPQLRWNLLNHRYFFGYFY